MICAQMFWCRLMLKAYLIKSGKQSSLSWTLIVQNKLSMSFNKLKRLWQQTEFHPNWLRNLWENGFRSFWFPHNCDHEWRLRSSNLYQNVEFSSLYHYTMSNRNWSVYSEYKPTFNIFLNKNHMSRVLSIEYWLNKTKWVLHSPDH